MTIKKGLFTEEFAKGFTHAVLLQSALYEMRQGFEELLETVDDGWDIYDDVCQLQATNESLIKRIGGGFYE